MRKASPPPLIILLDVLFIFLFISFLDQNKSIDLVFSGAEFPVDVGYLNDKMKPIDSNTPPKGVVRVWNCKQFKQCKRANSFIYLPDSLSKLISQIATPIVMSDECKGLTIPLQGDKYMKASINFSELLVLNPCMRKMHGVESWVMNQKV